MRIACKCCGGTGYVEPPPEDKLDERGELEWRGWYRHLKIGLRAFNVLAAHRIRTPEQLLALTPHQMIRWKGCGTTTMREIERVQAELREEQKATGGQ